MTAQSAVWENYACQSGYIPHALRNRISAGEARSKLDDSHGLGVTLLSDIPPLAVKLLVTFRIERVTV